MYARVSLFADFRQPYKRLLTNERTTSVVPLWHVVLSVMFHHAGVASVLGTTGICFLYTFTRKREPMFVFAFDGSLFTFA